MAKSSIHIDKGEVSFLAHNLRKQKTVNSIFDDEENYYSNSFDEAVALYREELRNRTAAYTERTGQKIQSKTTTLFSAILNLNQEHDENDVQKIVDHLEKTLDTKVVNFAIHRDEGHIDDKTQKPIKNYHAHIMFLGLDSDGNSIRRKLTRSYLSKLQSETAQILKMERGVNYARERKPRPRRLDTYEFKEAAKQKEQQRKELRKKAIDYTQDLRAENAKLKSENSEAINTVKELRKQIEEHRQQMKEAGIFSADDYRELSAIKKSAKKATLLDAIRELQELQRRHAQQIKELEKEKEQLRKRNEEIIKKANEKIAAAEAEAEKTRQRSEELVEKVAEAEEAAAAERRRSEALQEKIEEIEAEAEIDEIAVAEKVFEKMEEIVQSNRITTIPDFRTAKLKGGDKSAEAPQSPLSKLFVSIYSATRDQIEAVSTSLMNAVRRALRGQSFIEAAKEEIVEEYERQHQQQQQQRRQQVEIDDDEPGFKFKLR